MFCGWHTLVAKLKSADLKEKRCFESTESIHIQVGMIMIQQRLYIIDWSFEEMKDKTHI